MANAVEKKEEKGIREMGELYHFKHLFMETCNYV